MTGGCDEKTNSFRTTLEVLTLHSLFQSPKEDELGVISMETDEVSVTGTQTTLNDIGL